MKDTGEFSLSYCKQLSTNNCHLMQRGFHVGRSDLIAVMIYKIGYSRAITKHTT